MSKNNNSNDKCHISAYGKACNDSGFKGAIGGIMTDAMVGMIANGPGILTGAGIGFASGFVAGCIDGIHDKYQRCNEGNESDGNDTRDKADFGSTRDGYDK